MANYLPEINEIKILEEDLTTRSGTIPITMRHLLTHTSGIAYSFNSTLIMKALGLAPGEWPLPEVVPEGIYDWGFNGPQPRRVFEAGDRWQYGRSLGVAGRVVERISGLDLDTYFKMHIFNPLGMTRSGYNISHDVLDDLMPMSMRDPVTGQWIPMPSMPLYP